MNCGPPEWEGVMETTLACHNSKYSIVLFKYVAELFYYYFDQVNVVFFNISIKILCICTKKSTIKPAIIGKRKTDGIEKTTPLKIRKFLNVEGF